MKQNKGQVTIFVIIGVLLLISSLIVFNLRTKVIDEDIDNTFKKAVGARPDFVKPVGEFVDNCLKTTLKDGLILLGQSGGVIYTDEFPLNIVNGDFVNSDGVLEYGHQMPYWFYVKSKSNSISSPNIKWNVPYLCKYDGVDRDCFGSAPTLDSNSYSFESQLERYVKENLDSCLNNFTLYKEKGIYVNEKSEKIVTVKIRNESFNKNEGDVLVRLNYELEVSSGEDKNVISMFENSYDLDLYSLYIKMFDLVKFQAENGFVETYLNKLLLEKMSSNKIPAKYEKTIRKPLDWSIKEEIYPVVDYAVRNHIPLLRVLNSANDDFGILDSSIGDYVMPVDSMIHSQTSINVYNETYNPLTSINFDVYPDFDVFLWMGPDSPFKQGDKIKEVSLLRELEDVPLLGDILTKLPLVEVYSSYYISFPLMVNFKESLALEDDSPYFFKFPIEANMINGKVLAGDVGDIYSNSDFDLFCDERIRENNLSLSLTSSLFGTPVEDAKVTFFCAGSSCEIGNTDRAGKLNKKYPKCLAGGYIEVKHGDYLLSRKEVDVTKDSREHIRLDPIIKHNYTIKKIKVSDLKGSSSVNRAIGKAVDLNSNDTVTVSFIRNPDNFSQGNYVSNILVENGDYSKTPIIELVNGNYSINAMLMSSEEFFIPHEFERPGNQTQSRCIKVGKMSELAHISVKSHPLGGNLLDFSTDNHYICRNEPNGKFFLRNRLKDLGEEKLGLKYDEDKKKGSSFVGRYEYLQKSSCNSYVDNVLTKKLPKFIANLTLVDRNNEEIIILENNTVWSKSKYDSYLIDPLKSTNFEDDPKENEVRKLMNTNQIMKLKSLVEVSDVISVNSLHKDYVYILTADLNHTVLVIDEKGNNITLENYKDTFYVSTKKVEFERNEDVDLVSYEISNLGLSSFARENITNHGLSNLSSIIIYDNGNTYVKLKDPEPKEEYIATEDGLLNSQEEIIKILDNCSKIILNDFNSCKASCGQPSYNADGSYTNEYYICMQKAYDCTKEKENWNKYESCYFDNGFCNQKVKWTNTNGDLIPVVMQSQRVYDACNLRSGYFTTGLTYEFDYEDSDEFEEKEDVDMLSSVIEPLVFDDSEYYQFGNCPTGLADTYNNFNLSSEANIVIDPITNDNKPFLSGGLIANEGSSVYYEYEPYLRNAFAKNMTIYVFEYDYVPIYYDDFKQQQQLFEVSTKYGKKLLRDYLK